MKTYRMHCLLWDGGMYAKCFEFLLTVSNFYEKGDSKMKMPEENDEETIFSQSALVNIAKNREKEKAASNRFLFSCSTTHSYMQPNLLFINLTAKNKGLNIGT